MNHAFGLEDRLPFGKHKGKKIRVVLNEDAAYMLWLVETCGNPIQLDNAAFKEYQRLTEAFGL